MKKNNPFCIPETVATIDGFDRRRQEGDSFWLGDSGERVALSFTASKLKTVFFVIFFFLVFVLGRLFWLQIIKGADYAAVAEGNRLRVNVLTASRGIIYDRFNVPLVANISHFSLFFIPADLPASLIEKEKLAAITAKLIARDESKILELFLSAPPQSYSPVLIADEFTHAQSIAVSAYEDSLSGIKLSVSPRREYISGYGLSHVLGYLGEINAKELSDYKDKGYQAGDLFGKSGLEVYYEEMLHGQNGEEEVEVDTNGKPKKTIASLFPVIGKDIILTLDLDLQKKLAESLSRAIIGSHSSGAAAAVAINPENGEILALVSLPDFDNNFFSAGIKTEVYEKYLADSRKPLFNRAIAGAYPPGSIFKPIVAAAALEEGIITESKTFLSTGGLQIDKWFFPDWKTGGHGRINIISALANSVNTFFYYLGGGYADFEGLGAPKIKEYAYEFNLGQPTGIDLPGEVAGFVPDENWKLSAKKEPWYIGDTYHLAIGQGDILVTPLQVALYTSAIANGGTLYQPHLLKEIKNGGYKTASDYLLKTNFISQNNINIIRKGLRETVLSGSARSLQSLNVAVAGKTGTAQVAGDKPTHSWFAGFAPYNKPKIAIAIIVENGGEGSLVAVPVFKDVVSWYFNEN
ncbi:penicillin-binding protein 2 [Candidatus Kuenenbacteria bacterium RIFCSPHIGHO2_02_FULL_42_29]|uniref:Penicillin-binding protein 2 n=1 Tax=Candidatus Kuenenbacteria bacterium RIFCSPLOWO2_02_FULL_42_16 TaxID=1798564 RepID=A0A1F6FYP6_9BACT|nr:MAG: penicillin-binding protein 2 [Candidatus Kuenenbacteria bacterium RIFCSPHIGHO2_02_FULL_42_29]OGG90975.1 MAG: penicillin-binding protein 2 [Candidatus Kuenenbacteria bacterium RIFCSPLOWO2_02_FULL_42_16]